MRRSRTGPGAGPGAGGGRRARVFALGGLLALASALVPGPALAERAALSEPHVDGPVPTAAAPPEVGARAWVLLDVATGQVLAERRGEEPRPVASTIKILTALTVHDRADLDDPVRVGDEVLVGGASVGLRPGDEWTVEQLLDGLVARSGNDAAEALAVHVAGDMEGFVERMRRDAEALGLEDAVITEASGLADGNELSARQLGVIARAALHDDELRPIFARARVELPGVGSIAGRNELLEAYPGATGMKTGYTAAAGFSLVASAERDGRELLAVVLDADPDPARFQDAMALLDHGFDDFTVVELAVDWAVLVAGGRRTLTVPPVTIVVPAQGEVDWAGLPPPRPEDAREPVGVRVDGHELTKLDAELGPPVAPVPGGAALGRALVDETYAAMRGVSARDAW